MKTYADRNESTKVHSSNKKQENSGSFESGNDKSSGSPSSVIQTKLATGESGNQYEKEMVTTQQPGVQMKRNEALPENVQLRMESAFGESFSNINIHKNSSQAKELNALAFTQGNDVHFAPGQFSPNSKKGQELIGHEFAHVQQQRAGRVQPTIQAKGMAVNDDKHLESEADKMGAIAANYDMASLAGSTIMTSAPSKAVMMGSSSGLVQKKNEVTQFSNPENEPRWASYQHIPDAVEPTQLEYYLEKFYKKVDELRAQGITGESLYWNRELRAITEKLIDSQRDPHHMVSREEEAKKIVGRLWPDRLKDEDESNDLLNQMNPINIAKMLIFAREKTANIPSQCELFKRTSLYELSIAKAGSDDKLASMDFPLILSLGGRESGGLDNFLNDSEDEMISGGKDTHKKGEGGMDNLYDFKKHFDKAGVPIKDVPKTDSDLIKKKRNPAKIRKQDQLFSKMLYLSKAEEKVRETIDKFKAEYKDLKPDYDQLNKNAQRLWILLYFSGIDYLSSKKKWGFMYNLILEQKAAKEPLDLNAIESHEFKRKNNQARILNNRATLIRAVMIEKALEGQSVSCEP